jgi:phosphopantetheine adenylyltransferase
MSPPREGLPSLLLLPAPPEPASRVALDAAYRPPLETAIAKLKDPNRSATLVAAVGLPILNGEDAKSKALSWADAQVLLANLYTIISVICAKLSVPTDMGGGPGSVDIRFVLVDYDSSRSFDAYQPRIEPNSTAVIDLPTFAAAYHPWQYIFHAESEAGLRLNAEYLKFAEGVQRLFNDQLVPVDGGLTMHLNDKAEGTHLPIVSESHEFVCLGGTFDHLHPGHKLLLSAAALLLKVPVPGSANPCRFVVGITGDELLKNKKYAEYVQPWEDRARNVLGYLYSILHLSRDGWEEEMGPKVEERDGDFRVLFRNETILVQCVRIQDAFGPTITAEDITALVVSRETRAGGTAVNDRRAVLGWRLLQIFEVDVLDAEEITDEPTQTLDFASKISSTAIRRQKAESSA